MRPYRLLLACLIATGLSPGIVVRDKPQRDFVSPVEVLELDPPKARAGPLSLVQLWEVRSENDLVGGLSGLIVQGPERLVAASDAGRLLFLERGGGAIASATPRKFVQAFDLDKLSVDIESISLDAATGKFWLGYENSNAIQRFSAQFQLEAEVFPKAMQDWPDNAGPEAMVRLSDGRFIVMSEGGYGMFGKSGHPALLFESDPTGGGEEPLEFTFRGLSGYRPVDMAELPDGRVIILMRSWSIGFPPVFQTAILIADPALISGDVEWQADLLGKPSAEFPKENYEGIAVEADSGDDLVIWLVSDDNFASFQRTLLVKLRWKAWQKARR